MDTTKRTTAKWTWQDYHWKAMDAGAIDGQRMALAAAKAGKGGKSRHMDVTQQAMRGGGALRPLLEARGRNHTDALGLYGRRYAEWRAWFIDLYARTVWGHFVEASLGPECCALQAQAEAHTVAVAAAPAFGLIGRDWLS